MNESFEFQKRSADSTIENGAQSCATKLLEDTTRSGDRVPLKTYVENPKLSNLLSNLAIDKTTQYKDLSGLISKPTIKPEVPTHSEIDSTKSGVKNFYEDKNRGFGPVYSNFGKLWQEHNNAMAFGSGITLSLLAGQLASPMTASAAGFLTGVGIASKGLYSAVSIEGLSPRRRFDHVLNAACGLGMALGALAWGSGVRTTKVFALYTLATLATAATYVDDSRHLPEFERSQ